MGVDEIDAQIRIFDVLKLNRNNKKYYVIKIHEINIGIQEF